MKGPFRLLPRRRAPVYAPGDSSPPSVANARAAAAAKHERVAAAVLELDLDKCLNSFGVNNGTTSFCTATGTPCYNTFGTCKDKLNYRKGLYTWRFCSRGLPLPADQPAMRPYIDSVDIAPSEIDPTKGLAIRSLTKVVMADEPEADAEGDPYRFTTRGGYALHFDGATQYVNCGAASSLSPTVMSIEAWIKPGTLSLVQPNYIFSTGRDMSPPDGGLAFDVQGNGALQLIIVLPSGASRVLNSAGGVIVNGTLYHVLASYDGQVARLYVNGVQVTSLDFGSVAAMGPIPASYFASIGNLGLAGGNLYNFPGAIDGVRFYNRALSPTEVSEHYNGVFTTEAGLVGRWEFDEGTGTVANDSSGNLNTGTLVNGPTWVNGIMPTPNPAGTFWRRMLARTKNYAGRFARIRRGFVQSPWSWDTFQTELFIVESITGPDSSGKFSVQLSDPLRLLDKVQIPAATDGKLLAQLDSQSNAGFAQSGGASTIQLAAAASQVDGTYVGEEVYILAGLGSGQRRVVSAYVGLTRTATVSVAWTTVPDSTSSYEVTPLSLALDSGKGSLYPDPSVTGTIEYVTVKDETIRYTKRSGDVLSWPDGSYRAQFGTDRASQSAGAAVQLAKAWVDKSVTAVITDIVETGGVASTYIDLAGLQSEDTDWFGANAHITTCIIKPTKASDLLKDLLIDLNLLTWWDPVAQLVKFKADLPAPPASVIALTDDNLIQGQTRTQVLDKERITRAALYFAPRSSTVNLAEAKNFSIAKLRIDSDAESPNEYGDNRPDTRYSRWLSSANDLFATATTARKLGRLRNSPISLSFRLDPRDDVSIGDLRDINSRALVDATGAPQTARVRITKRADKLTHLELEARSTNLGQRFAFIAPAGQPDYESASAAQRDYAYICASTGLMSDGTSGYVIA